MSERLAPRQPGRPREVIVSDVWRMLSRALTDGLTVDELRAIVDEHLAKFDPDRANPPAK
jgi:hypothetical protein